MTSLTSLERRAHALDIALHTVQVTVDGDLVTDAASAPLGPHVPQRMYSISKTVTALAVGALAGEGRLGLDDPVASHFPEMGPVHPWLEATTIRHMLAMRGPHRSTTYKLTGGGWLESYFRVPPTHPPGTLFTYDTSAAYTLAALVERVSGTSLADYLRPRVLDPVGVTPGLRFLTGPEGISHGGSGLVCTPRDLLRLAQLLLDGGVHDGAALVPADFLAAATAPQADTATQTWGASLRGAYGYQTWLPPRGGWLMFGLGGQIVHGDPARGRAVVVTADAQACASGDQRLLDLVLDSADDLSDDAPGTTALTWPRPRHDAGAARPLTGRWTSRTPGAGPESFDLDLAEDGGRLASTAGWELPLDFDAPVRTRVGPEGDPAVVTAGWTGPGTLDVRCAMHGDELATVRMRLAIAADGTLAVQSQGFGETLDPRWTFHAAFAPPA